MFDKNGAFTDANTLKTIRNELRKAEGNLYLYIKTDITMSASEYILKQKVKPINGVSICSKHTNNVKIDSQENMDSTTCFAYIEKGLIMLKNAL